MLTAPASTPGRRGTAGADELLERNRRFYDSLWARSRLSRPERFNTWPRVSALARERASRLEVGAGLRPRLPVAGTCFADISRPALAQLAAAGGRAALAHLSALPYGDGAFELVAALDILEHVRDDERALGELARVMRPDGRLMLSFPLHEEQWTSFDELVGHHRRYEPERVRELLARFGLTVQECAVYGMKPRSSRLVDFGMRMLQTHPERAIWWYDRVFLPIGMRMQKPLEFRPELIDDPEVHEVIVVVGRAG